MRSISLLCCLFVPFTASAQTGVSDDRVSLPSGPGSIDGAGDNAGTGANHGSYRYSFPIETPKAHGDTGPSLSLEYDSGNGNTIAGIGWRLDLPSIERSAIRGLPKYTADDELVANGSEQLVHTGDRVYRARYEQQFVRYTWLDAGAAGYWKAEYPDGSVAWFGASPDGAIVDNARLGAVFRWSIVESRDVFGHAVRYEYGSARLISRISWGGGLFEARFTYEPRSDVISDCTPGFEELIDQRLAAIEVRARGNLVGRYAIRYERVEASGGLSRIASIETFGRDGSLYPVTPRFTYSRGLGGGRPRVTDMGSASGGLGIGTGAATLIDLSGDGLPDIVDGSQAGALRIFTSRLDAGGDARLGETPRSSMLATANEFPLGNAHAQVLDLDGNGLADLINTLSGRALCNQGTGDFAAACDLSRAPDLTLEGDPGDLDPAHTRFVDLDGDRRIDMLRTTGGETIARVLGPDGYESLAAESIGADFDTDHLELADLNGDGMLDLVRIAEDGSVRYRLSFGFARWSPWRDAEAPGLARSEVPSLEVEDLDGDGLADLVVVASSSIRYALNQSSGRFAAFATIDGDDIEGALPARSATTLVLFADMNASGSTDVVWVERSGNVRYLEMFPARPNLLERIENGVGLTTRIAWGTLARHRARDLEAGLAAAWPSPTPGATNVVDELDSWTGEIHEVRAFRYAGGFYSPIEHAFRGFESLIETRPPNDAAEEARIEQSWDVGRADRYRASLLLRESWSAPPRALREHSYEYGDCAVTGANTLVRHLCLLSSTIVHQEGRPEAEWITTREELEYDGYGRILVDRRLGVIGAEGDERITETAWLAPAAVWRLDLRASERVFARAGGASSERRFYYDGPDFAGLPLGAFERGALTRVEVFVDETRTIDVQRFARNTHGEIVVSLDPLGAPDDLEGHRTERTYDADGLHLVAIDTVLEGSRRLRRTFEHDPVFDRPIAESKPFLAGVDREELTRHQLDAFGRVVAVFQPGDAPDLPSQTYAYELGDPSSRIVLRTRSRAGGDLDLEQAACLDGRGRTFATRSRIGGDRWLEEGFTVFDQRGMPVRAYEPRETSGAACTAVEPSGVAFVATRYDALGRSIATTQPDGSIETIEYLPLAVRSFSAEDRELNTPQLVRRDGLERTIAVERMFASGGAPAVTRFGYDALGRLELRVDAAGNEKRQTYDRAGRVLAIDDPQSGRTTMSWDDAGNLSAKTDARSVTLRHTYDRANRLIAVFEEGREAETRIDFRFDADPACASCENGAGELVSAQYPLAPELAAILGGEARGRDELSYDARGRLIREARVYGRVRLETTHELDLAGRELATVYPDGRRVLRVFDGASRLTSVPSILRAEWDPRGLMRALIHEDGTEDRFEHDPRRRLIGLSLPGTGGERRLSWDRDGRLRSIAGGAGGSFTARSDAEGRLLEVAFDDGETLSFGQGASGVLESCASSLGGESPMNMGAFDFSRPGLVSRAGSIAVGHDAAGFLVDRGGLAMRHDAHGRFEGGGGVRYMYGRGRAAIARVEGGATSLYPTRDFEVRDGIGVTYVRANGLAARLESAALAAMIYPDLAADGVITAGDARLAGTEQLAIAMLRSSARRMLIEARGDVTHLHNDHLGTPVVATRGGEVIGTRSYYAYGVLRSGEGFVDRRGFTGQDEDATLGLIRFAARFYDPLLASWTSVDPLFESIGAGEIAQLDEATQRAGYVGQRPLDRVDPTGLAGENHNRQATKTNAQKSQGVKNKKIPFVKAKNAKGRLQITEFYREGQNDNLLNALMASAYEDLPIFDSNVTSFATELQAIEAMFTVKLHDMMSAKNHATGKGVSDALDGAMARARSIPIGRGKDIDALVGFVRRLDGNVEVIAARLNEIAAKQISWGRYNP